MMMIIIMIIIIKTNKKQKDEMRRKKCIDVFSLANIGNVFIFKIFIVIDICKKI